MTNPGFAARDEWLLVTLEGLLTPEHMEELRGLKEESYWEAAVRRNFISDEDLLKALAAGMDMDVEVVGDHMTGSLITAAPEWPLQTAADQMVRHGIRHVLVFEGPELAGILSMRDVIRVGGLAADARADAA